MNKKVLIIGGTGFIGKHTSLKLVDDGYKVYIMDQSRSLLDNKKGFPENVEFRAGSVVMQEEVKNIFEDIKPEIVIFLAAFGSESKGLVPSSEQYPHLAVETNILGLVNILRECKKIAARLIWTSSTTVFGPAECYSGNVVEESLVGPKSVYAASKVFCEQLIRTYRLQHGIDAVAIRPTLVWGPGIQYRGIQAPFCDMVEAFAFGKTASVPYNDELWDLIYVKDVARAIALIIQTKKLPIVITVTGYVISIDEFREYILRRKKSTPIIVEGIGKKLDLPLVDTSKAELIGFNRFFDVSTSIDDYISEKGINV